MRCPYFQEIIRLNIPTVFEFDEKRFYLREIKFKQISFKECYGLIKWFTTERYLIYER